MGDGVLEWGAKKLMRTVSSENQGAKVEGLCVGEMATEGRNW